MPGDASIKGVTKFRSYHAAIENKPDGITVLRILCRKVLVEVLTSAPPSLSDCSPLNTRYRQSNQLLYPTPSYEAPRCGPARPSLTLAVVYLKKKTSDNMNGSFITFQVFYPRL